MLALVWPAASTPTPVIGVRNFSQCLQVHGRPGPEDSHFCFSLCTCIMPLIAVSAFVFDLLLPTPGPSLITLWWTVAVPPAVLCPASPAPVLCPFLPWLPGRSWLWMPWLESQVTFGMGSYARLPVRPKGSILSNWPHFCFPWCKGSKEERAKGN